MLRVQHTGSQIGAVQQQSAVSNMARRYVDLCEYVEPFGTAEDC